MLRYGHITEMDPEKGLARVKFSEDNIVSDWLQLTTRGSKNNKMESWHDVDEFVACLMDERIENGVILGAVYSKKNTPAVKNKDTFAITFSDGTVIKYDRSAHSLSIDCTDSGTVQITCKNATVTAGEKVTIDTPSSEFTGDVSIQGTLNAAGIQASDDIQTNSNIKAVGQVSALEGTPGVVHLTTHMHPTAAPGSPSPPTPGT